MSHKNEADILKEHGELTAEVSRLKGELGTANTTLSAKDAEIAKLKSDLTARDAELTTVKATAAKVPGLETKVTELEAKDMDADKRAAAVIAKAGIRGDSTKQDAKDEPKLTLSQQCLKARGVAVKPEDPVVLIY